MIYGLLFIIILIYCYEYWKMISKYKYLFFQNEENTIENLNNKNEISNEKNISGKNTNKIVKQKIKESFSGNKKQCDNCQFTPYNFNQLSNHAIDVPTFNESENLDQSKKSNLKNKNRAKLDLLKLQDKVIKFFNNLIKNYNNLLSEELKNEEQINNNLIIDNLILVNKNSNISLINPNKMKQLFKDKNISTFLLVNPSKFMKSVEILNETEINNKGKQDIIQFMNQIFEDLKKIKEKYQISNLSNKQIEKTYFLKKPIYSKYYPNDIYISNKLGYKHQYINKPIIREQLPCKWKCQRSWFQCHYAEEK